LLEVSDTVKKLQRANSKRSQDGRRDYNGFRGCYKKEWKMERDKHEHFIVEVSYYQKYT